MKKANELFELIKSLTTNEKRYFKLYARLQEGTKNYMELFDALEQQTEYNEADLLKQYADAPFTRHFSFTKNYLYKQILRALAHSQTDNFVEQTLWEGLQQAKVLGRKQLYRPCERLIENIRQKAYLHEDYVLLVELLLLKGKLVSKFAFGNFENDMPALVSERELAMQLHQNYMEYKNLNDKMFHHIVISGSSRKAEAQNEMSVLMNNPLMLHHDTALGKKAKIIFHNLWFLYAYYTSDIATSLYHKEQALSIIESIPTYFTEDVDLYINNISNIMVLLNMLQRYEATLVYMEKLKQLKVNSAAMQSLWFQAYYNTSLVVYAALADVEKPLALVSDIEAGLEKYKDSINKIRRIDLCFNVSILYFKTAQYGHAHQWLEKVLNESGHIREDVQCFARIFNLLIHYEMGNHLLLESLIRNYGRYLQKHKKVFQFEKVMLQFFNKAVTIVGREAIAALFKDLQAKLYDFQQDPKEKLPLTIFDFVSWVESKIEGLPLLVVMKRKVIKAEERK